MHKKNSVMLNKTYIRIIIGFTCVSKSESAQVHLGNLITYTCRVFSTLDQSHQTVIGTGNIEGAQLLRTSTWRVSIFLDHQRQVVIYLDLSIRIHLIM